MRSLKPASTDWSKVDRKLKSSIKEAGLSKGAQARYDAYCIAFLKWVEKRVNMQLGYEDLAQKLVLEHEVEKLAADAVEDAVKSCGWGRDSEPTAKKVFAEEALASYLLNVPAVQDASTPAGAASLALGILDIAAGESVVDLECGVGSFLSQAAINAPDANLFGFDVNKESVAVCQMKTTVARSLAMDCGIAKPGEIRVASAFDDIVRQTKYDKAFSNHPLGLGLDSIEGDSKFLMQIKKEADSFSTRKSAEWAFCQALVESLREGGRAVALMSGMATSNPLSEGPRKDFVSNGWVEGVISLPAGSIARTAISQALVVFSQGNSSVRFIDASHLGSLDEASVSAIVSSWRGDCGGDLPTATATLDELASNRFDLDPARFMMDLRRGTSLGQLSGGGIRRGLSLHGSEAAAGPATEECCLYLKHGDVVDGRISLPQVGLSEVDREKAAKLALKEGDLLISRTGAPDKVAVAEALDGRLVIPSDNFYAVTLDKAKINPWYAAAFLNSPSGENALKRAGTGSRAQVIALSALEGIEVPIVDMGEQERIASVWKERMERISAIKAELEKATGELHDSLWD